MVLSFLSCTIIISVYNFSSPAT